MTNSEKVQLMRGSKDDQRKLFDYLIDRAASGEQDDSDIVMLEFLKRELTKDEPRVVQMTATMRGAGSAGV
jgi:hypothetical protein